MSATFSNLAAINLGGLALGTLFSALLTLILCLIVIRVLLRLMRRLLARTKLDARVQKYLVSGVKLLMYVIAILIVVQSLGIPVTSLVALLSVCSLGITLAAENVLGNVAGGLVLLTSHPFVIGDVVEADGVCGVVEEITLNHTKLLTPDGLTILVPSKTLSSSKLTNYTALGRRRVTWDITASYDAPTEKVKAACFAALKATDLILEDPAPDVWLTEYHASSIQYSVYCWCAASDYLTVRLNLGEHLRDAFAAAGVEMTYDHLNVHVVNQ